MKLKGIVIGLAMALAFTMVDVGDERPERDKAASCDSVRADACRRYD